MIKVTLSVQEGPHQNRKLRDQWTLSVDNETALAFFFSRCKVFGIDENFFAQCPPGQLAPVAQALVGRHALANVIIEEWQNQARNKIKSYAPYVGTAQSVMPNAGGMPGMSGGMPNVSGGMMGMPNVSGMPGMVPAAQVPTYGTPTGQPQPSVGAPGQPAPGAAPSAPVQAPQQAYAPVQQQVPSTQAGPTVASLLAPSGTPDATVPTTQTVPPAGQQYQANMPM